MAAKASSLWTEPAEKWRLFLDLYPKAIKLKSDKKTKPQAKKDLLELDKWFQEQLPSIIQSRTKPHITLDEIKKLMTWKLSRGKFRPALPGLVAQNKDEEVVKASEKAFSKQPLSKQPNLSAAIQSLSTLRGIGPATASAVLAAGCPEEVPFMADESVMGTPGIPIIKYDLKCYLQYAKAVQDVHKQLKEQDADSCWTCHKVELALWTHAIISQLDPSLLDSSAAEDTAVEANNNIESDAKGGRKRGKDGEKQPTKKPKKA